jgi:HAD superfamily hydrolase (TIGR01509 family)
MDDTAENRWILLDLDDTLVGTRDSCYRASSAAARELGLPVLTERAFNDVYGRLEFAECVAAWFGDGHFDEFNQVYLRKVRYTPVLDVRGLVARVRRTRLRVGVVTNSSPDEVNRKLHDIDVPLSLFDFVVTPVDLQIPKPDSRAFTSVLEKFRISPARALYVSDHPADGRGSRAAGMAFAAVLTGIWTAADFRADGIEEHHIFATVHDAVGPLLVDHSDPAWSGGQ